MTSNPTSIEVVREQVTAFNDRDLERFLATYGSESEVIGVTAEPLLGAGALREFYTPRFEDPSARCTIETYVLFDDRWVVAREAISNSQTVTDTIATFEVRAGVITRASMIKAEAVAR